MEPTARHLGLVVDGLTIGVASARLTQLVVQDKVWGASRIKLRNALRRRAPESELSTILLDGNERIGATVYPKGSLWPGKLDEMLACPQCAGVWVTGAVLVAWHYGGRRTRTAIRAVAVVGIQSHLARRV